MGTFYKSNLVKITTKVPIFTYHVKIKGKLSTLLNKVGMAFHHDIQ